MPDHLPRIRVDDLNRPKPYTTTQIGNVQAHNMTIPVMVITDKEGTVTVSLNKGAHDLGTWLEELSAKLSAVQVETLADEKRGAVKL